MSPSSRPSAVWAVMRADLRDRRGALARMAVLLGVLASLPVAALAASERAAGAFDRYQEANRFPDLVAIVPHLVEDSVARAAVTERLSEIDGVEVAATFGIVVADVVGAELEFPHLEVGADGQFGSVVNRPVIIDGRRPDPRAPHEVWINPAMAEVLAAGPGDRVELRTFSPDQAEAGYFGGPDAPKGPVIEVTVVGVGRAALDIEPSSPPSLSLSPAFVARHGLDVAYVEPHVMLRYADGADAAAVEREVRSIAGEPALLIRPHEHIGDLFSSGIDAQVVALQVLAAAAAAVTLVVMVDLTLREASSTLERSATLRALGATTRLLRAVDVARFVTVALLAPLATFLLSLVLAHRLVRGAAADIEPDPGQFVDLRLIAGAAALGVCVVLVAAVVVTWLGRGRAASRRARPAAPVGGWPRALPLPTWLGVRFSLERGGPGGVPARRTHVAAVLSVAAVAAMVTVTASVDHLIGTPAAYGHTWEHRLNAPVDLAAARSTVATVRRDEAVAAAGLLRTDYMLRVAGENNQVQALEGLDPTITAGRAPASDDETALGGATLAATGLSHGDHVAIEGRRFLIVGTAVLTDLSNYSIDDGALVTMDAFDALLPEEPDPDGRSIVGFDLRDGSDHEAALARLRLLGPVAPMAKPSVVLAMGTVRPLLAVIAAYVAIAGVTAIAHAVLMTTRHRRGDLGVLVAMGATRRLLRRTLRWQSLAFAAVGLTVGLVPGIAVGRAAWRAVATELGVPVTIVVDGISLGLVATGSGLAAVWIAFAVRHLATRHPLTALRAE